MSEGNDFQTPPPPIAAIEEIIDGLRPALLADGGNVEILGIDADGTLRVSMQGTCATCPAQLATVRIGLEEPLKLALPGVSAVVVF